MIDHDEDEQPKRSFKVEDRRRFADSGEARGDVEDKHPEADSAPATPPPAGGQEAHQEAAPALEMNFSTFLISLSTQALALLGELEDPVEGRSAIDLVAAKHLIDILGILKDKTKGNLDEVEGALLEHCLYDLRMKYVEVARHHQPGRA